MMPDESHASVQTTLVPPGPPTHHLKVRVLDTYPAGTHHPPLASNHSAYSRSLVLPLLYRPHYLIIFRVVRECLLRCDM